MENYDTIILGGGLAGLSLSIQLAQAGRKILLLEKNKYPFHRVCGEYISMESWDFLERLGLPLNEMDLPRITRLKVTSLTGREVNCRLNPGGFGISRYTLDDKLASIASASGVDIRDENRAEEVLPETDSWSVETKEARFSARVVAGCFGKRSNLDKKLNRSFELKVRSPSENWVGVKYHLNSSVVTSLDSSGLPPENTIELHNFDNGYCGISKVEDSKYCLCYLTKADNLRRSNGNIQLMEEKILSKNPFLKKYFSDRTKFLFDAPVTISQITFDDKLPVENNILMVGDAAGMIAPLCGNGMSMAMHSSAIAFPIINRFLNGALSRSDMEREYTLAWCNNFKGRLQRGRFLQPLLVKSRLTNFTIPFLRTFPYFMNPLIKSTHGKPF